MSTRTLLVTGLIVGTALAEETVALARQEGLPAMQEAPPIFRPCPSGQRSHEQGCVTDPLLIRKVEPAYPEKARKNGIAGRVEIRAVIEIDGSVTNPLVLSCTQPGYGLEEAALAVVTQWRYTTPMVNDWPVRTFFTIVVTFSLMNRDGTVRFAGDADPVILDDVPDSPDTKARYVLYLHGRIVEEEGRRPTDPNWGVYEYDAILRALAVPGTIVISEQRPPQTDMDEFAEHVVEQVRSLLGAGVPAERITVTGFSKGGGIAIRTSALLQEPRVNFAFLAACGDGDFRDPVPQVTGRILSIYEASDEIGRSCRGLFKRSQAAGERYEVKTRVGDHHGTFYRVHPEWLDPLLRWAASAPSSAPGAAR